MTSRRARRRVFGFCLLVVLGAGEALGSFECLPGPTPGGLADWAGWSAFSASSRSHGWTGSLALGRPVSVENLGWSYAVARWTGRGASVSAEGFFLALDDLYREAVVGIWAGHGGISLGLRRWQVDWQGGTQRSGLTLSGRAAVRYRQIEMRVSTQDLQLGRRDPAAPEFRFGATAGLRLHASLALEGSLHRSQAGPALQGALRWSPFSSVTLHQVVRFPGQMLMTGVEFDAGRTTSGVWMEPTPRLGLRVGVSCSLRSRSSGRR